MADAYRGLVIRIGGDVTELKKALYVAEKAASQTNRELRKIEQGLKMDPTNLELASKQIGYVGQQAANTAERVAALEYAIKKAGDQDIILKTEAADGSIESLTRKVSELYKDYEGFGRSLAQDFANATNRYNDIADHLAQMNNQVTEIFSNLGDTLTDPLKEALTFEDGRVSLDAFMEQLEKLPNVMQPSDDAIADFCSKVKQIEKDFEDASNGPKRLEEEFLAAVAVIDDKYDEMIRSKKELFEAQVADASTAEEAEEIQRKWDAAIADIEARWKSALDACDDKWNAKINKSIEKSDKEIAKINSRFEALKKTMTDIAMPVFNATNGNNDLKTLRDSLMEVREQAGLSERQIDDFIAEVARLKQEYALAKNEQEQLFILSQYEDAQNELLKTRAALEQVEQKLSEISSKSSISTEWAQENAMEVEVLDRALDQTTQRFRVLSDAFQRNSTDTDTLRDAVAAYAEQVSLTTQKVELLQRQMDAYDESDSGLQQVIEDAGSIELAAERARVKLAELQTSLDVKSGLKNTLTNKVEEASRNIATWKQELATYESELAQLGEKSGAEVDQLNKKISAVATSIDEAYKERDRNKNTLAPLNDEIEGLKANVDETKEVLDQLNAARELVNLRADTDQAKAALKQYEEQVKATIERLNDINNISKIQEGNKGLENIFSTMSKYVDIAMNDVSRLNALLKENPDNENRYYQMMETFDDAVKGAEGEVRNLNEQLSSFDVSGLDQFFGEGGGVEKLIGSVRDMSIGEMLATVSEEAKKADLEVVELETNLKKLQDAKGPADEMTAAGTALDAARARATEFATAMEKATEYRRVQELRSELIGAEEDSSKLLKTWQEMHGIDITPKLDDSFSKELQAKLKTALDSASGGGEVGALTKQLERADAELGALTTRASAFRGAMSAIPNDVELIAKAESAVKDELAHTVSKAELLGQTLDSFDMSKIDMESINLGTVEANFLNAKENAETLVDTVQRLEKAILAAEQEMDAMSGEFKATDEGKRRYEELNEQVLNMRVLLNELRGEQSAVFGNLNVANATKSYVEMRDALAKTTTDAQKLRNELEQIAKKKVEAVVDTKVKDAIANVTDAAKRYDDAIKSAIERAKQYNEVIKSGDGNVKDAREEKAKAIDEALALAVEKSKMLNESLGGMNTDVVKRLTTEYGSFGEAAVKTRLTLEDTERELAELSARAAEFAGKNNLGDEWVRQFTDANSAIEKVPPELENVRARIVELGQQQPGQALNAWVAAVCTELEKLGVDADTAKAHVQELADQISSSGSNGSSDAGFQQVFSNVVQYAERAASAVSQSASTIDAAYRDMRKTVNGTEAEFEKILDEAVKFSQTHIVTADQMLEMEALGGQLGIAASELSQFGEIASNLDIATDISAEQIALQMGQIKNIMSDINDMDDVGRFADALVRLGNNAAAQESSIMDIAQRIAAVANVTSMTTPEILAWSAAIAETGMHSESAATSLVKTMTGIGEAVAGGGDKLKAFAEIAHMSADQFKSAWENSSSEALELFVKGLSELTDNSTEAIEALDSVGISSVRQETSLLALSQTIGNLDDNLAMSRDAFNGISDQWGDAGDAANEAANKSEGFSGALGIMQSNMQNLSASLGEALIPFLQLASTALAGITNLLNAIPAPIQSVVVGIGGITAIGGSAINVIGTMVDGFKKLADSGGAASQISGQIGEKMGQLIQSLTGAEVSVGALGSAFATGLAGVAVVAITALITKFAEFIGELQRAEEAERSLQEAGDRLVETSKHAVDSIDDIDSHLTNIGVTASEVTDRIEAMRDKLNELNDTMEGRRLDLDIDLDMLQDAVSVIEQYADKQNLTYEQQADLKIALGQYNDILGTNLELVNSTTGAIKDQGDGSIVTAAKIRDMADSYGQLKKGETELENLNDAYKAMKQAEAELSVEEDKLAKMRATQTELQKEQAVTTRDQADAYVSSAGKIAQQNSAIQEQERLVEQMKGDLEDLKATYENTHDGAVKLSVEEVKASDEAAKAINNALQMSDAFTSTFEGGTEEAMDLAMMLVTLGATTDSLAALTDADMAAIAAAYDGNIQSIIDVLGQLKVTLADTSSAAGDAASKAGESAQAVRMSAEEASAEYERMYNERKDQLDDMYDYEKDIRDAYYNDRKRQLDAEYNDVKRAYDAEYDALKRALDKEYDLLKSELDKQYTLRKRVLDAEYDDLKSTLDKEYDARKKELDREYDLIKKRYDTEYNEAKKSYDAEYKAAKKAYDAEYNAAKKSYDQQYNARKKVLDAEYNEVKKSLDNEYNARKKALDKEYKTYQKQSQKYLKQYKKQLNEQVTAFKKATESRVDEIKKELKAQQDLIDAETKRKTDDIDARIAALRGETEAMEKEEELRTRNEKIAELQRNVTKAKSRRTRAEAQKELSDYLNELAIKDAKEQNEILIAQLEEEKALLEEDADNRKDLLAEQYDAEIEAYKEARALQLEALQEYLDEVYEREQEAESERLEAVKERQQAELDGIKEQNNARLEAIKEQHSAELEGLKEAQQAELEAIKEGNQEKLDVLKEQQQAELDALKQRQSDALQNVKDEQQAELDAIKEHNEAVLEAKKQANEDELQALKDAHQAELDARKESNELTLQQMKTDHEIRLEQLKNSHAIELEQLKNNHEEELEEIKRRNERELEDMKAHKDDLIAQLQQGGAEQKDEAAKIADGIAGEAERGSKQWNEHMRQAMEQGRIILSKTAPEFGKLSKEQQDKILEQVYPTAQKYREEGEKQFDAWAHAYNTKKPLVTNALSGAVNEVDREMKGGTDKLKERLNQSEKDNEAFWRDVKGYAQEGAPVIKQIYGEMGDDAKHYGEAAKTAAQNEWKDAFGSISKEAEESKGLVQTHMQDARNAVTETEDIAGRLNGMMGDIAPNWEISGGNASVGLHDGILSAAHYAYDAAAEVASNVVNMINSALDIHSPSKVTTKIGEYVSMGLAVGMENKKGKVDKAAGDIAGSLGDEFVDNYLDGLSVANKAIDDCIALFGNRMEEGFESLGNIASNAGLDTMVGFVEGFDTRTIEERLVEILKMFKEAMYEIRQVVSDSGIEISRSLADSLSVSVPAVSGAAQNTVDSISSRIEESMSAVGTAKDIGQQYADHLVNNIIDDFRQEKDHLRRVAEEMAQAVEDGFQPDMALDAAQEAAEKLKEIENRYRESANKKLTRLSDNLAKAQSDLNAAVQSGSLGNSTNVSIDISSLVVREEADIDRIARQLALRVDQVQRARLGR